MIDKFESPNDPGMDWMWMEAMRRYRERTWLRAELNLDWDVESKKPGFMAGFRIGQVYSRMTKEIEKDR